MSLLPLSLGVKRNLDSQGGGRRKPLARAELRKLLERTLERDKFSCRYCGFTSRQYQKAIPKDWAVNDPRDGELVTACIFCEQCLSLETVASMGSGTLIWLPSMDQPTLNHLARTIYVTKARIEKESAIDANMKLCADRALDVLLACRGEAKRRIGTDDPAVLAASMLENINDKTYRDRNKKLEGVRLLPLDSRVIIRSGDEADQFPAILNYWISEKGPYGKIQSSQWAHLASFAGKAEIAA